LLENNADVHAVDKRGRTPLLTLIDADYSDVDFVMLLDLLLSKKADVNLVDPLTKMTLLTHACEMGEPEVVQSLLKHKADITRVSDATKATCLHHAAESGSLETVSLLLNQPKISAIINAVDKNGHTAFQYAVDKYPEIAESLKAAGAEVRESREPANRPGAEEGEEADDDEHAGDGDDEAAADETEDDETTPFVPKDITQWLEHHGLTAKCMVPFKRNKVQLHDLAKLTVKDFGRLGIVDSETRQRLARALETVDPSDFPSPSNRRAILIALVAVLLLLPILASLLQLSSH